MFFLMMVTLVCFFFNSELSFFESSFEFEFSGFLPFTFSFFIDLISLVFFLTVLLISLSIYFYSKKYMHGEKNLKRFFFLLLLFIISMILLIFSGGIFSSFIGWDFLGLSSLLLIFFYLNHSALKAGILTFFVNRLGDCLFLISIIFFFLLSMNYMHMLFICETTTNSYFFSSGIFFFLTGLTKSAQIPFSTWLPAAMQAPTPVSSLVHSSTLVTAGYFILFRFFSFWSNEILLNFLFTISLSTTFLASFSALEEMDLKKIIAFSTLSHLGFIMMILSLKLLKISFFYMIMHAFFKALLFMTAGIFIHQNTSLQDIRSLQSVSKQNPVVSLIFCFSLFSMSGFPFLTGFFSKDAVLDVFFCSKYSFFSFFLVLFTVILTVLYSMKMAFFLMPKKKTWNELVDDDFFMWIPMLPLFFGSILFGSSFFWIFFDPLFCFENSKTNILVVLSFLVCFFWCLLFFHKKKIFFLSKMWFLIFLTDFFFIFSFKKLKIFDFFSDLQGFQGNIIHKISTMSLKKKFIKKFSQYFLMNFEFLFLLIFTFLFWYFNNF